MELIYETYKIVLDDKDENTCYVRISPNSGKALLKDRRKLYIISTDTEIVYVGEAHTSILKRFQRGTVSYNYFVRNNKAKNGNKGYKWLDKNNNTVRELNVITVVFNKDVDNDRELVEAIEGELVYLIRQKTGKWPLFQNEIHFHNKFAAKTIAKCIFEKAFEGKLVKL